MRTASKNFSRLFLCGHTHEPVAFATRQASHPIVMAAQTSGHKHQKELIETAVRDPTASDLIEGQKGANKSCARVFSLSRASMRRVALSCPGLDTNIVI